MNEALLEEQINEKEKILEKKETREIDDGMIQIEEYSEKEENGIVSDDEKDDLFGDNLSEEKNDVKIHKEFYEEMQKKAVDDTEYHETKKILESTLVNCAVPESTDGEIYYVKMPNFLTIAQKPFDRESYLEEARLEREEAMIHPYDNNQRIRLKIENTIRWRYVKNEDNTYSKQSNAYFIKWSDGSLSLLLGSELFSAVTKNNFPEHTYLCLSHENQNLLMSRKRFTKNMTFLPIDTKSSTHKKLTEVILRGNMKKCSIIEFVNVEDPEKVKREAERIEEEKARFRRRLESKRRARDARYNESSILTIEGLEAEETRSPFLKTSYIDKDDDDDGFIVDDESDEAERLERLRKVKEDKGNIYKKQLSSFTSNEQRENDDENNHLYTGDDDDNDDAFLKDTDAEEQIIRRMGKRRRIVSDEELDETDIHNGPVDEK
ncbi:hypothetical protein PORY_002177 [Pneumocystis oryctolagi]|uniref:Uncharacterized protein n=1 Tax=Pneumocystis oryctolagi TaxID=42067 RepID=A0ACB7CD99_9ASCO|nr:hypothetical protein PORY_002177 [Pneumocystis oryctolagi]